MKRLFTDSFCRAVLLAMVASTATLCLGCNDDKPSAKATSGNSEKDSLQAPSDDDSGASRPGSLQPTFASLVPELRQRVRSSSLRPWAKLPDWWAFEERRLSATRVWALLKHHIGMAAQVTDPIPRNGNRLGPWIGPVHGENGGIGDDQTGTHVFSSFTWQFAMGVRPVARKRAANQSKIANKLILALPRPRQSR